MKFEHTRTAPDFGGTLTVTAETPAEVPALLEHFKPFDMTKPDDIRAYAAALEVGTYTHTSAPKKRLWYFEEAALDHEYLKPYMALLERITGYTGDFPDIDLTPHHPRRLCHTHHTAYARTEHGHYTYGVILQAEDWNGKPAQVRAGINAQDYAEEDIGYRPFEREYIQNGGRIIRNPNYHKRHRAKPATGAPWLWAALFQWWRDHHATDGQRAALDEADADSKRYNLEPGYLIRDNGEAAHLIGHVLYLNMGEPVKYVTWDQFKAL